MAPRRRHGDRDYAGGPPPDAPPPAASFCPGGGSRRRRDAGTLPLLGRPQAGSQTPGERADRRAPPEHDHRHPPTPRGPGATAGAPGTRDPPLRTRRRPRSVADGFHGPPRAADRPGPSPDDPRRPFPGGVEPDRLPPRAAGDGLDASDGLFRPLRVAPRDPDRQRPAVGHEPGRDHAPRSLAAAARGRTLARTVSP